jgi:long-subunit acyl-CoA synthetase (AMP-forming)
MPRTAFVALCAGLALMLIGGGVLLASGSTARAQATPQTQDDQRRERMRQMELHYDRLRIEQQIYYLRAEMKHKSDTEVWPDPETMKDRLEWTKRERPDEYQQAVDHQKHIKAEEAERSREMQFESQHLEQLQQQLLEIERRERETEHLEERQR